MVKMLGETSLDLTNISFSFHTMEAESNADGEIGRISHHTLIPNEDLLLRATSLLLFALYLTAGWTQCWPDVHVDLGSFYRTFCVVSVGGPRVSRWHLLARNNASGHKGHITVDFSPFQTWHFHDPLFQGLFTAFACFHTGMPFILFLFFLRIFLFCIFHRLYFAARQRVLFSKVL